MVGEGLGKTLGSPLITVQSSPPNGQRFASISVVILVIVGRNMFSIFTCTVFCTVGGRGGEGERIMSGVKVGGQGGTVTHQGRLYFFEAQITRQSLT